MENIQHKEANNDVGGGDSRIKAAESSDFVDDQGHAKVNDPVEPPARFAPKGRGSLDDSIDPSEPVTTPGGGTKQMDPNSILTRLYDPDRMQKPAIWKFIKLVAPGPADQPPPGCMKWRSKDAIAAYCLKCKKQFTYTKGTSKTISRHMMAYHGLVNTDGETDITNEGGTDGTRSKAIGPSAKEPPLKKRKKTVTKGESQPLLLLKWLVGSFRPFTVVDDLGFKELVRGLPEPYTKEDVLVLARSKVESAKAELHQQLGLCEDFSLAYEVIKCQGMKYCSVRITFCTAVFERHSLTIKVAPCGSPVSVVEEALQEYGLSSKKITNITRKHATEDCNLSETATQLNIPLKLASRCILHTMDHVVMSCLSLDPVKQLLALIQEYVKNHKAVPNCKDAYKLVQDFLELPTPAASKNGDVTCPTMQQQSMARALREILQPFYDATKTLSVEPYPMMAIPVFRRINDVLGKVNVNDSLGSGFEATSMEQFRQSICTAFEKAFEPMLNGTTPFMWTVPIDPRLIHMKGLSASEKDDVVATLTANVKRLKLSKRSSGENIDQQGQDNAKNRRQETSTMAGLFFGEDAEVEGTDVNCSDEDATSYARTSVDRYIETVKSNRRIEDPLGWWKANQDQFPELSLLARKWLGASTIFLEPDGKAERDGYHGDHLEVVSFLHDNIGLI
ncbi:unnamed protein product [Cylindrotheca closterium]|uniref:HAT C-terminal dimerisation domain-containing protein n=1 Tax=Cylindrotheca closterium TaxID=2856 RepID=A0AAD2FSY1_9STRA|nr:unnamed protein product [Cylindrotheca closterium]